MDSVIFSPIKISAVIALLGSVPMFAADQVINWNVIATSIVANQNPFAEARFLTITQLAVSEALNAITGESKPYLGSNRRAGGSVARGRRDRVAHAVLRTYFPGSAASLDAARTTSLASIPDGAAKSNGLLVGEAAAAAMIASRASDGAGSPQPYTPLTGPGHWQPTPPGFGAATLLHWASVTPFGLRSGSQFRSDPPPSLAGAKYPRNACSAV